MLVHTLCDSVETNARRDGIFALLASILGAAHPEIMEKIKDPDMSRASLDEERVENEKVAALMQRLMCKASNEAED